MATFPVDFLELIMTERAERFDVTLVQPYQIISTRLYLCVETLPTIRGMKCSRVRPNKRFEGVHDTGCAVCCRRIVVDGKNADRALAACVDRRCLAREAAVAVDARVDSRSQNICVAEGSTSGVEYCLVRKSASRQAGLEEFGGYAGGVGETRDRWIVNIEAVCQG